MENKVKAIQIRVSDREYEFIKKRTTELGFKNVSEYIRHAACRESSIIDELEKINNKLD